MTQDPRWKSLVPHSCLGLRGSQPRNLERDWQGGIRSPPHFLPSVLLSGTLTPGEQGSERRGREHQGSKEEKGEHEGGEGKEPSPSSPAPLENLGLALAVLLACTLTPFYGPRASCPSPSHLSLGLSMFPGPGAAHPLGQACHWRRGQGPSNTLREPARLIIGVALNSLNIHLTLLKVLRYQEGTGKGRTPCGVALGPCSGVLRGLRVLVLGRGPSH